MDIMREIEKAYFDGVELTLNHIEIKNILQLLETKDDTIYSLVDDNEGMEKEIENLEDEVVELEAAIGDLEEVISDLRIDIQRLGEQLK